MDFLAVIRKLKRIYKKCGLIWKPKIFLGTYVLTLILWPLVNSCENTRPMISITEDYNNIIYPVLQKVENIIANDLQSETCKTKERAVHECEENNERSSIHKMVSAIQLKLNNKRVTCYLKKLVSLINISLGCNSKDENGTHSECAQLPGQRLPKKRPCIFCKLCRVQQVVNATRSCYAKLKEKNG